MKKAYYLYRPHPYFEPLYPGKVLNKVSDRKSLMKYLTKEDHLLLAKKFFPDGLGPHGLQSIKEMKYSPQIKETITELIFEFVRQIHFPESPSRLSSLYASESPEHAQRWKQLLCQQFGHAYGQIPHSLWEIKFETNAKLYDASLLNTSSDDTFSFLSELENAHRYWNSEWTESPMPELLIPYPVTVVCQIQNYGSGSK